MVTADARQDQRLTSVDSEHDLLAKSVGSNFPSIRCLLLSSYEIQRGAYARRLPQVLTSD